MADTHAHGPEAAHAAAHAGHPTWRTYVVVGFILTVITAIEVAIFYIPALANVIVPALLVLSAAKFLIVVLFYMHLKFDNPIFGRVFYAPLFLALLVVIGLIILFKVLPGFQT
ncbi:MAG: cytochrome C oxidase subunit IV family protein [Gemmatimonadota bacterium]